MDVCVVGAGSLGSLIGGLLTRATGVTVVGRDPHMAAVTADGLQVTGELTETTTPTALTSMPDSADLAVVTVKAYDTGSVASALATTDVQAVLSLQNGLGNEDTLAHHVDCPVLAGVCTYGARLAEPGVVECTGIGTIALGPYDGGMSAVAEEVGAVFRRAEIQTTVAPDMPRRLWTKLAVNAGINPVTALAQVPNGAVADGPASEIAREAARETARVARAEGMDLDPDVAAESVSTVAETTAANTSSMRADMESGERTEIDAINGAVLDRAEDLVPVNRTLTAVVRAWEAGRGLR